MSEHEPGERRDRFGERMDGEEAPPPRRRTGAVLSGLGIMLICQWAAGFAFLTLVVPQFKDIYSGMKVELPLVSQLVLAASDFSVVWWYVVLPVAFTGVGALIAMASEPGPGETDGGSDPGSVLAIANATTFIVLVVMVVAVFIPMSHLINP
jgi:hypothetical protein